MKPFLTLLLAGIFGLGTSVRAASVIFNLSYEFSGAQSPTGTPPWLTATLTDVPGAFNSVLLTIDSAGLSGSEYLDEFLLNFKSRDGLTPSSLKFDSPAFTPTSTSLLLPSPTAGENAYKADGDGLYDVQFLFADRNKGQDQRFGADLLFSVRISVTNVDLFAADFLEIDAPGNGGEGNLGDFYAAAHIHSIVFGGSADGSGWIGADTEGGGAVVPEPGAYAALMGLAVLGVAWVRRRK